MENDPRRRRSRGGRRRGGGGGERPRPTRTPAEPKPPQRQPSGRGAPRASAGRAQPTGPQRQQPRRDRGRRGRGGAPRSPDDLRPGTPCVIVLDCREGEPDRSGAAAVFEGFFDLETGEPRRAGYGVPRLRLTRAAPTPAPAPDGRPLDGEPAVPLAAAERPDAIDAPAPALAEVVAPGVPPSLVPVPAPRPPVAVGPNERLWGFECWWRPDPDGSGLTEADRLELEQSKKLLRGLIRDSRRSTRPRELAAPPPPR